MANKILDVIHVQKHDTESNWTKINPVLMSGELGFTTDGANAGKHKVGDGVSKWTALSYAKAELDATAMTDTEIKDVFSAVLK